MKIALIIIAGLALLAVCAVVGCKMFANRSTEAKVPYRIFK